MRTVLADNKRLITGIVVLAVLLATLLFVQQQGGQISKTAINQQSTATTEMNIVGSMMGSNIQESLDRFAAKVKTIDEARQMLPYKFPVPTDYKDHELTGIYVDMETLYLRYGDAIYIIFHAVPSSFDPHLDETLSKRPDFKSITVRGNRGIAGEAGQTNGYGAERVGGELIWYESGLDIAIYSYNGTKVGQLMKMANSMKWPNKQ